MKSVESTKVRAAPKQSFDGVGFWMTRHVPDGTSRRNTRPGRVHVAGAPVILSRKAGTALVLVSCRPGAPSAIWSVVTAIASPDRCQGVSPAVDGNVLSGKTCFSAVPSNQ